MYDIKWKNDLKMYINTFNSFIFEGNINDLQPVEFGDGFTYCSLSQAIAGLYSDEYCVVFYDHTKQSGKEIPASQKKEENDAGHENDDAGERQDVQIDYNVDETWFNSFTFYKNKVFSSSGDKIPSPNIELLKEYYSKDYLDNVREKDTKDMQGSKLIDIRRIYDVIADFENKRKEPKYHEVKPFMFILPDVSRYMTEPGNPKEKENAILMILFNITQLANTNCKLMMFVDKINDLPTWFESESSNSSIKKLLITMPDGKMRENFYMQEMLNVMDPIDGGEMATKVQKFVAYTENYSMRRLMQLKTFIMNEEDNRPDDVPSFKRIDNIDKTVLQFDFGQSKDPWRDKDLRNRIAGLAAKISEEIKGQETSIIRVAEALKSAVVGVNSAKKNDRRPRAIFFFAGPTGTGKTELAKQLAEVIFQKQDSMIRFDMSEFREEHSDARLFGAPPGYVGYEAGGELTKAIKQNPFSIVLFDEIEKAAPRIWDKFLQILGDGRLTDGKGETVSFTQSIIIFTSNLGITADASEKRVSEKIAAVDTREIDNQIKQLINQIKNNYKDSEINLSASNDEKKDKPIEEPIKNDDKDVVSIVQRIKQLEKDRAPLKGLTPDLRKNFLFSECYSELGIIDGKKYEDATEAFNAFVAECVRDRILNYFESIGRREVLGRIGEDNIMVFNFISPDTAIEIAKNSINKFTKYLKFEHGSQLELNISKEAEEYILNEAQKPETLNLGGRGIVACVEKLLSIPVGEFLFENSGIRLVADMNYKYGRLLISLR